MSTFALAVFLLIVTPGPGVLTTAGFGAAFGFRAGLRYVLGLWIGNNMVMLAVATGLAALLFQVPYLRLVLTIASAAYLLYLAARIAFAGSRIGFIAAEREPGVAPGIALQAINPKAYVVATTLFSGFAFWPDSLPTEIAIKFVIMNAIWIPIHLAWLAAGAGLERLNLAPRIQRTINIGMALAMLGVVALAALSAR